MEDYDSIEDMSSEIRYLTLELMKLAKKENKSFMVVLNEFVANAYVLQSSLEKINNSETSDTDNLQKNVKEAINKK